MNKIKVSSELGKSIDAVLDWFNGDKEIIVTSHGKHGNWAFDNHRALNGLSAYKLSEILIRGYEVELAKEEQAYKKFQDNYETACTTPQVKHQWYANGFNQGIEYMNKLYNLGLILNKPL